jgi:hypothetical protein
MIVTHLKQICAQCPEITGVELVFTSVATGFGTFLQQKKNVKPVACLKPIHTEFACLKK